MCERCGLTSRKTVKRHTKCGVSFTTFCRQRVLPLGAATLALGSLCHGMEWQLGPKVHSVSYQDTSCL